MTQTVYTEQQWDISPSGGTCFRSLIGGQLNQNLALIYQLVVNKKDRLVCATDRKVSGLCLQLIGKCIIFEPFGANPVLFVANMISLIPDRLTSAFSPSAISGYSRLPTYYRLGASCSAGDVTL